MRRVFGASTPSVCDSLGTSEELRTDCAVEHPERTRRSSRDARPQVRNQRVLVRGRSRENSPLRRRTNAAWVVLWEGSTGLPTWTAAFPGEALLRRSKGERFGGICRLSPQEQGLRRVPDR